jgi:hypothetical protein
VAEYGAVIYDHKTGATSPLLSGADQSELDALRAVLGDIDDVHLDHGHRYAVRAYRIEAGRRRRLDQETIQRALAKIGSDSGVQAIQGEAQTDFVTARFNKGTGLRTLAKDRAVAMAVGDTASDLPMFELAARSFAPSNADDVLRRATSHGAGLTILSRPHQAGLFKAVTIMVGHRPGCCPSCWRPVFSPRAEDLVNLLAAQDLGRWRKLGHLMRLAALAR